MRPEARELGRKLLAHHRAVTTRHPPGARLVRDRYLITYSDICERAGLSALTRIVGGLLNEVAEWCGANGHPPINSLVVNAGTRIPGDGYDAAAGCDAENWPEIVEQCIRYEDYPVTIE